MSIEWYLAIMTVVGCMVAVMFDTTDYAQPRWKRMVDNVASAVGTIGIFMLFVHHFK